MSHRSKTQSRSWMERALSLVLAAVLLAGTIPAMTLPTSAHWADQYLDQLVDWGVMRADQTANPDSPVTRAEFAGVINRAYGYTEKGEIPFEDVAVTDWFYDDISIAYTAGYMAGTSETTASPNETLTREMAVCILGRNMMMKETPGESLAFSDSRDVSFWAQGMVKTAVDNYIISGYPDNSFGPQDAISRGQMAVLVSQCLGNPISESGSYELGGVFGNVTITAPNVTLRNTTISGDLYVSGGVGLGGIKLENVNVLGRIIVSGTGESEGGDASVIMRNVTAEEMLVDNMRNKTVTIRADGITDIAKTTVRTNAYLEDNNTDDKGLMSIELDGEPGTRLTLAGRIKEVVNKTPNSYIQVGKGTVAKITVDEAATNSTVQLDRNTKVKEMNLDVGTTVTGEGDIEKLNINAPGSVVSMLPDKIYIRPGLTASIAGIVMDHIAAEEGSLDPRLLSGYPAARDIAPTGFRADFAGNKKGTIYWAVSAITDGSIREDDLISPPSYGSRAISNGSLAVPTGGEEISAQVTGLSVGGSYYLSAILVDEQLNRSPVKVISFSTPDNTVPAFGQGYPYMSLITKNVAQVTVMPTKSCKMYYALLPQGAQAPTVNDLKSAAVTGNLGYGVRDVTKNTESVFTVNSQRLEELKTYTLYLWLTDVDGVNSSAIVSLPVPVPDETPPEFTQHPRVNGNAQANSVPMAATVNENATIYWAVVEEGADYPLPNLQSDPLSKDNEIDPETNRVIKSKLTSEYAKLCVKSGMSAIARGQAVAQGGTEVQFNITGLQAEKAYDLYYLAQDTAGNYTVQVYKLTGGLHTLDVSGPVITQSFSSVPSRDDPNSPLSSTDIILEFSENIRCATSGEGKSFLELYNNRTQSGQAMDLFTDALKAGIVLHHIDPDSQKAEAVPTKQDNPEPADWVVDYSNVTIEAKSEGKILITFPGTESSPDNWAVKLDNGEQYFFQFRDITDASPAMNPLDPYNRVVDYRNAEEKHTIPVFTTVFSQVLMRNIGPDELPVWESGIESGQEPSDTQYARSDVNFRLSPQSTRNTDESNKFDILIYTDTSISFDLYYRITDKQGVALEKGQADPKYAENVFEDWTDATGPDKNGWYFLGSKKDVWGGSGVSVGKDFAGYKNNTSKGFPSLKNFSEDIYYEFVISITKNGTQTKYENFSDPVTLDIYIEAGRNSSIFGLAAEPSRREEFEQNGLGQDNGVANIGLNQNDGTRHLEIKKTFPNTKAPTFQKPAPWLSEDKTGQPIRYLDADTSDKPTSLVGDTYAYVFVNMDIKGTVHYVVSNKTTGLPPTLKGVAAGDVWDKIPTNGEYDQPTEELTAPEIITIAENSKLPNTIASVKGSVPYPVAGADQPIELTGLTADTEYYIYFVLESEKEGNAPGQRSEVFVYKFKTAKTTAPRIRVDDPATGSVTVFTSYGDANNTANVEADLTWRIIQSSEAAQLKTTKSFDYSKAPKEIKEYYTNKDRTLTDENGDPLAIGGDGYDTLYEALQVEYHAADVYTDPDKLAAAEFDTRYDGYTLFDLFASVTDRSRIQRMIDLGEGVTPLNNGTANTTRPGNYTTGVEWISGPNANIEDPERGTYLFLISGHNIGSSTGSNDWSSVNSFRLRDNVKYTNKDAPKLLEQPEGVQGSVYVEKDHTISASVSLLFNKDVYWKKGSTYYKVETDDEILNPPGTGTEGTVGLLYAMTKNTDSDADIEDLGENPAFGINFSNIRRRASYFTILGGDGGAIAANGGDTAGPIMITISYREEEETIKNADGTTTTNLYYITSGSVSYNNGKQRAELDGGRYLISTNTASIDNKPTDPSITVTPGTVTMKKNETKTLTAKTENGPAGSVVEWKSSNPAVATVSANGVVTGVMAGTSVITATYKSGGVTLDVATAAVTVLPTQVSVTIIPPTNLSGSGSNKGSTIQLKAEVKVDGVVKNDATVTWTSSDTSVATVTPNGLVTVVGSKDQTFTITAKYVYLNSDVKGEDTFTRKIIETISGLNGLTTLPK